MMQLTRIVIFLLALLNPWTAFGQSQEMARNELKNQNIPWSTGEFIHRAEQGDTTTVELFLSAGVDPNAKNQERRTALILAAGKGYTAAVQALLDKGAEGNVKDKGGRPALMEAGKGGHPVGSPGPRG